MIELLSSMICTAIDFDEETVWERTVLSLAIPVLPLTASTAGLDFQTGNITIAGLSGIIGNDSAEDLRNSLLPLLFGAAWKIFDLGVELALNLAGRVPRNRVKWSIDEKSREILLHGTLPGFSTQENLWRALGTLYGRTKETRHALVHRRVRVDPGSHELTGFARDGARLPPFNYDEQMAFCRAAQRLGEAISDGSLKARVEADLRGQLALLQRHHESPNMVLPSTRPPVRVRFALPASSELDVKSVLAEVRKTFPGIQYVDIEIHLGDGRVFIGELENAPQERLKLDPDSPPDWIKLV